MWVTFIKSCQIVPVFLVVLAQTAWDHKYGRKALKFSQNCFHIMRRIPMWGTSLKLHFLFPTFMQAFWIKENGITKFVTCPLATGYYDIHALLHGLFHRLFSYYCGELNVSNICRCAAPGYAKLYYVLDSQVFPHSRNVPKRKHNLPQLVS